MTILQIIENTVSHVHPIWDNVFFYFFVFITILSIISIFILIKMLKNKTSETNLQQQQHIARINNVRKEQTITLEKIRIEMLKREEERVRQWMESEKETLHVLSGVSTLLELSDKVDRVELKKIMNLLDSINKKLGNGKN